MKQHKKQLLILLFILIVGLFSPLMASTETSQILPYGIGVQFSPSIWGLSYHQRFDRQAIQGTIGISYDPDPLWDSMLAYGIAIDYQHTLYENHFNEYLGAQIYATTSIAHAGEIPYNYSSSELEPFEAKIIVGAGFGVEILFFQNFSLPVEIAYEFSYTPTESDIRAAFALDLVPRVGLRFRFK
jgi:hypothetical protein